MVCRCFESLFGYIYFKEIVKFTYNALWSVVLLRKVF